MTFLRLMRRLGLSIALAVAGSGLAAAQTPPSAAEIAAYDGLHRAAADGDVAAIERLVAGGAEVEARDRNGRTPLHVAAFASHEEAVRALAEAGADLDALDTQAYDIVTIAAVADDRDMLETALALGASPANVTSPYDGTALIAAAHLGHAEVVRALVAAGAPLDHVNNLGWTALIEAVVLGDGGPRHQATVEALLKGGADPAIADREGKTPLRLARERGFEGLVHLLKDGGRRPR